MTKSIVPIFVGVLGLIEIVLGHGYVLEPVGRGSRWRFNSSALPNYDDNGQFCGGFATQWYLNDGKCGLCGDDYASGTPRLHELDGLYGEGVVVRNYTQGQEISVIVQITANHGGYFEFKVCNLDANSRNESEACFEQHRVLTTSDELTYKLPSKETKAYEVNLKLPDDLVCQHCVLQWTYITGNNWGFCDELETIGGLGCGIQENFRTCSDIAIFPTIIDDFNDNAIDSE